MPKEDKHHSPEQGLKRIIELKPKFLLITGGEPLLVPDLRGLIKKIKSKINPYIVIDTNATLLQQLVSLLPYVDGFQLSIDGIGKINEQARGVSGDEILENIEKLSDEIKRQGLKRLLNTVAVITRHNYSSLPFLAKGLNEINPNIQLICLPMMPYDHPDSIAYNIDDYLRFVDVLEDIIKEGFKIRVTGPFSNQGPLKEIFCYRQYFRGEILTDGTLVICKPYKYRKYFFTELAKAKSSGNLTKFISTCMRMLNSLIIHRYDALCPFPCGCDDFIEAFLFARDFAELWRESYELLLRVPESEQKDTYGFIRKYINPEFNIEFLNTEKLRLRNKCDFIYLPIFMYSKNTQRNNINEIVIGKS